MKPTLQRARWLLVRTTDYVQLKHIKTLQEQTPFIGWEELQRRAGPEPESGLFRVIGEDGAQKVYCLSKAGKKVWLSNEQVERKLALRRKAHLAWQKKRDKARADLLREYAAKPAEEKRFSFGTDNPVLGRNLPKRVRILTAPDQRRLDALDLQIERLQGRRKALLESAWERGISIVVDDLPVLAKRASLPSVRKTGSDQRRLDHIDTIWPKSFTKEKEKAAA